MENIKVLIVEDNPLHAERIEMLLEDMEVEIAGITDNALDALQLLQSTQPDILLLDIHISGGFTGIELAERVRKNSAIPIIYISSIRDKDTFTKAKHTQPDAFVYKPIEDETLMAAVELALHKVKINATDPQMDSSEQKSPLDQMVFLRIGNSLKKVKLAEVVYAQVSAKNYCDIRTIHKRYSIKSSLNDLIGELDSTQFLRVSRTHIINLNFIEEINEKDAIIETGFESVPLGKGFKMELYERMRKV